MTYTKQEIEQALDEGGAEAVRALLNPEPITDRLIYRASLRQVCVCDLARWYVDPNAVNVGRKEVDLMGEVSPTQRDGWLPIMRGHLGYLIDGVLYTKARAV